MGPHPAVAAIRLAVRRVLHDVLVDSPAASAPALPSPASPAQAPARVDKTPGGVTTYA